VRAITSQTIRFRLGGVQRRCGHLIGQPAAQRFRFLKWLSRSPMARCADAGKPSGAHFNSPLGDTKAKIMSRDSRPRRSAHELPARQS